MMRPRSFSAALTFLLVLLAGCVRPGTLDETLVQRYQRALVRQGAQRREGKGGIGLLRPAETPVGPELRTEPVERRRVVETTEAYRLLEELEGRKRIEIRRKIRTTTFVRDPVTGELAPKVAVEEDKPRVTVLDELPEDLREVLVRRAGRDTDTRSLVLDSRHLVHLSLVEAIQRALVNNLDIRVVSYDPAIAREDMVRAAAAFDFVLFGSTTYGKEDKIRASSSTAEEVNLRTWSAGVRQHTVTGADWQLEWALTRTHDASTFNSLTTRYEPVVTLQVTQPLLRNAWPEFNLAQLRVARINTEISEADFRAKLEELVAQVIGAYWGLVQARRDYVIQEELLDVTRETYERVRKRDIIDATKATIKQVEASGRIRQAALIRARKIIRDVQDNLARLIADPQVNTLSNIEVVPSTDLLGERVHVSATEQLLTALNHNPLLEQARLAIAASEINVDVAENQLLPQLDFIYSAEMQGMHRHFGTGRDKMWTGDHLGYTIGLQMEYPIGNRDRRANLRQRRYERTKSVVSMQNTADQIAVAVSERVRQISTTYEEALAQRAAVEAALVQLQALEDTERIRARLTPEFLRVKLQAQETLANAQRAELQALVDYNNAMAELARTTGTILDRHRVSVELPRALETLRGGGPAPR